MWEIACSHESEHIKYLTVGQRDRQVQCRGAQTKPFEYKSIYLVDLVKCVFKIWTKCSRSKTGQRGKFEGG